MQLQNLHDAINYPIDSKVAFTIWIISSLILLIIFFSLHLWWIKRPNNQKYLKVRQEEGIITFIKRHIFLIITTIFFISLITAIVKLIVWIT